MARKSEISDVLRAYPGQCQPERIEALGGAGGFSGAQFWKLASPMGSLCLRRWPVEHPSLERLQFIHAVLKHVFQSEIRYIPVPCATRNDTSYVQCDGHLWELTLWMPGQSDFWQIPTPERLQAAMAAMARFHAAAASFPAVDRTHGVSPGIRQRSKRLNEWMSGEVAELASAIDPTYWPGLESRAREILRRFDIGADDLASSLRAAAAVEVPLQPCIRDIWHDHVLFRGAEVTGLIDFGSLQVDNVASDVARLMGSLVGDDSRQWQKGLEAYVAVRSLSADELRLIEAFDRSTVLMAGLNWLEWIYRQRRQFSDPEVVLQRVDAILRRNLD